MDNSDSSDTSDEDYIPNDGEVVSEEEDSGDEEHFVPDEDDAGAENKEGVSNSKCKTRRKPWETLSSDSFPKSKKKISTKATRQRPQNDDEECRDEQFTAKTDEKKEEVVKNKTDALWADFMKDVGAVKTQTKLSSDPMISKATETPSALSASLPASSSSAPAATKPNKVTVVQEYNFAGETVVVTKEVDAGSKEAQEVIASGTLKTEAQPTATSSLSSSANPSTLLKRPPGGLNSLLSKLNKKPKLSTLEKSKLDWDGFKQKEGITEELQIHNRGKDGYLERVAFLERTDQRQYEIERNLRLGSSHKQ